MWLSYYLNVTINLAAGKVKSITSAGKLTSKQFLDTKMKVYVRRSKIVMSLLKRKVHRLHSIIPYLDQTNGNLKLKTFRRKYLLFLKVEKRFLTKVCISLQRNVIELLKKSNYQQSGEILKLRSLSGNHNLTIKGE